MKKIILLSLAAVPAIILAAFFWSAFFEAQRADYGWSPDIGIPAYVNTHPRVLFDEGHNNASMAGFTGRYWPFARLIGADGYAFERGDGEFTPEYLAPRQLLIIANASGSPKPQIFGINIPLPARGERKDPAFTAVEIAAVRSWVERGGSLLLIADHAPFGEAAAGLGAAFGVTMNKGFVEVPEESSDPLLFSAGNGRLGDHPIISGAPDGAVVRRVMTFTGQSIEGPPGSAILLRLPPNAVEFVPSGDSLAERPAGPAQGLAFEFGKGRVVVLGEGGMVTAQVSGRVPYGMNQPDNDNKQFVLNVLHWLSGTL
jgi:hypothetical protein